MCADSVTLYKERSIFQAARQLVDEASTGIRVPEGNTVRFIMTGGAAMALYSPTRTSNDVEGIFSHQLSLPDILVPYTDESGSVRVLSWDRNYSSTLGMLHPRYEDDAIFVAESKDRKIEIMVLSPLDIAVTKIARYADNDQHDIQELFTSGLIVADNLESRAIESMNYYVGNIPEAVSKLDTALEKMGYKRVLSPPEQNAVPVPMTPRFTEAQRLQFGSEYPVKDLSRGQVTCKLCSLSEDKTVAFGIHGGTMHAIRRGNNAPMAELSAYKDKVITLSESKGQLQVRLRGHDKNLGL